MFPAVRAKRAHAFLFIGVLAALLLAAPAVAGGLQGKNAYAAQPGQWAAGSAAAASAESQPAQFIALTDAKSSESEIIPSEGATYGIVRSNGEYALFGRGGKALASTLKNLAKGENGSTRGVSLLVNLREMPAEGIFGVTVLKDEVQVASQVAFPTSREFQMDFEGLPEGDLVFVAFAIYFTGPDYTPTSSYFAKALPSGDTHITFDEGKSAEYQSNFVEAASSMGAENLGETTARIVMPSAISPGSYYAITLQIGGFPDMEHGKLYAQGSDIQTRLFWSGVADGEGSQIRTESIVTASYEIDTVESGIREYWFDSGKFQSHSVSWEDALKKPEGRVFNHYFGVANFPPGASIIIASIYPYYENQLPHSIRLFSYSHDNLWLPASVMYDNSVLGEQVNYIYFDSELPVQDTTFYKSPLLVQKSASSNYIHYALKSKEPYKYLDFGTISLYRPPMFTLSRLRLPDGSVYESAGFPAIYCDYPQYSNPPIPACIEGTYELEWDLSDILPDWEPYHEQLCYHSGLLYPCG